MKYFTKQYWRDMQKDLVNPDDAFEREMGRRWRCYQEQLKDVLPYLPKTASSYVKNESFNGAYVAITKSYRDLCLRKPCRRPKGACGEKDGMATR